MFVVFIFGEVQKYFYKHLSLFHFIDKNRLLHWFFFTTISLFYVYLYFSIHFQWPMDKLPLQNMEGFGVTVLPRAVGPGWAQGSSKKTMCLGVDVYTWRWHWGCPHIKKGCAANSISGHLCYGILSNSDIVFRATKATCTRHKEKEQ